MKNFDVNGKIVLVTGANRGIGEGFVKVLLNEGAAKIYTAVRNPDYLKPLAEQYPDRVKPVLLDVTNPDHIATLATKIDRLDILINNAGIINPATVSAENALEVARQEMETNYFAPINLTNALLPQLKNSKQAAVINVCSIASMSNFASIGPYSATKAALHSYTQGLRSDLSQTGIRVIGVYPGPIDTRMTEGWEMDKGTPEQVASRTLQAMAEGENDVFPDDFSTHMYGLFLKHPHELENAFAQMQQ